eukprot:TRINITY_DN408_c1_g1_i1.p1 TRINITY_DN408_c1_g1~~TRINITY_DN408_c1_g1_i1.p1  ORF type:complete len:265 (+),score=50.97 TRINITY_DN408_c1_g1_i1:253-1047(+)
MRACILGFLLALVGGVVCDDPSMQMQGVTELHVGDFEPVIKDSNVPWVVEFYAPWCGWCKKLAPVWEELGEACSEMDGVMVGKFDVTQPGAGHISEKYNVKGLPTIVLIKPEGSFVTYNADRSLQPLLSFISAETGIQVDTAQEEEATMQKPHTPGNVMSLEGSAALSVINDVTKNVFVKFYAPWCGHCKALEPEWTKLASQITDEDIVIAELDAAKYTDIGNKYGVRAFPTLMFFSKSDKTGLEYYGGRKSEAFVKFVDTKSE